MTEFRIHSERLQQREEIWVDHDPRNDRINALDLALYVLNAVLSGHQVVVGDDEGYQAVIVLSGLRNEFQAPLRVQAEQDYRNSRSQAIPVVRPDESAD